MKILIHGNTSYNNPEYNVHCDNCGCEYIARKNEVIAIGSQYNVLYYIFKCPECGCSCYVEEQSGTNTKKETV